MRYYKFSTLIDQETIFKNAKNDVGYIENALYGMNQFIYKHASNNIVAFAYSQNKSTVDIAICFDEKQISLSRAEENICSILSELDNSYKINEPFVEITRFEFRDYMHESRRREYLVARNAIYKLSKTDFLEYDEDRYFYFNLQEKIISGDTPLIHSIYDQSLKTEINNISLYKVSSNNSVNPAHYVISAKSNKAIDEIATILTNKLYNNNRLSSKRIELISEIHEKLYKRNYFESIVEDTYGGVVIINMTPRLGENAASYIQACEYIANIVKKHKNNCLFIFANNTNSPSFAYQIIKKIENNMTLIPIKEGLGDKASAEKYLKSLVKSSEYSRYASDVNKFLKSYRNNSFSQGEVLDCMDKFESWCVNHNNISGYNNSNATELLFGHEEYITSPSKRLEEMIGLKEVKKQINEIIAASIVDRERKQRLGLEYSPRTTHMIFAGNPGTAKTTVAKLFGQIAKENNLLKSGVFIEKSGTNLLANGEDNISDIFEESKGGILFIDEAYAIDSPQAITSLIQEMENHRDEVITILAGYDSNMKAFLNRNDGLKSRIPYWIDFPDYSVDELVDILKLMLRDRGFEATQDAINIAYHDFDKAIIMDNFGNGRYVRNYLDEVIKRQSMRLYSNKKSIEKVSNKTLFTLEAKDFNPEYNISTDKNGQTAKEKLDAMIGLNSAKEILNKALASFKMRKIYNERGLSLDKPTMHMVFTGNPGTAKTTTARLFAQILKDENILSSGSFIEVGRADLIGTFVGQTAPLIKAQFKKARGGVLFIDEAYSLCESYSGYGDEAINTIVQEMENHREDVVVIFAGYPKEMKEFLEKNPGMRSRIAFNVEFEDYSADELRSITELMVSNKNMTISPAAMEKLYDIYSKITNDTSFGNGRFVRQLIEEATMNLAERLITLDLSKLSKKKLTTIEVDDIPTKKIVKQNKPQIGFTRA